MGTYAAMMTGKGTGAIAIVQVHGPAAKSILRKIFKPTGAKKPQFKVGQILLGQITDGSRTIDQVTIGCEGPDTFAINCHGNPLIVEDIMKLLKSRGAELTTADKMLYRTLSLDGSLNSIAIEAKLNIPNAKSVEGTKILLNQIDDGLTKTTQHWLSVLNSIPLDQIKTEAEHILKASPPARLIIFGAKTILAGPPNSGKSTLLNRLAGRQKAIVSHLRGTTRDWVCGSCRLGPLYLDLTDTAGLAEDLTADAADVEAQKRAIELLSTANIILLILDLSEPNNQLTANLVDKLKDKTVLTVLNKSDLPRKFDAAKLAPHLARTVEISAQSGTGLDLLGREILHLTGVDTFDYTQPVAFTARQNDLLSQIQTAKSKKLAQRLISRLLNGPLDV